MHVLHASLCKLRLRPLAAVGRLRFHEDPAAANGVVFLTRICPRRFPDRAFNSSTLSARIRNGPVAVGCLRKGVFLCPLTIADANINLTHREMSGPCRRSESARPKPSGKFIVRKENPAGSGRCTAIALECRSGTGASAAGVGDEHQRCGPNCGRGPANHPPLAGRGRGVRRGVRGDRETARSFAIRVPSVQPKGQRDRERGDEGENPE